MFAAPIAIAILAPQTAASQVPGADAPDSLVYVVDPVVVTATRGPRTASSIAQPVTVLQRRDLVQQMPNTITDLFRTVPGLDVTGVGVSQGRPQIRGLKGQRILLLSDGIRMNNSRRQQDFGELPALVDVNAAQRIEVVRGPASVLYGSDAIGGVVNVISRVPEGEGLHGTVSGRYGGVESLKSGSARVFGRFGSFTVAGGGTLREADPYEAPAGTFGDITLTEDALVNGTGAQDLTADLRLGYEAGRHSVFGKVETYDADEAGFGSVDPDLYQPEAPPINITYPSQRFTKVSAGYVGQDLGFALADRFELLAYGQSNERELNFRFGPFPVDFGPPFGVGTIEQTSLNSTDIRTYGFRAEARKLANQSVGFTYGVDLWRDRAEGTDESVETCESCPFFVPPETTSDRPSLPEATYTSLGAFGQVELEATERLSLVGGARWQRVESETFETAGLANMPLSDTDATLVAAINGIYRITDEFSVLGSVGRAFRSPNLIERYFDGEVAEGGAYQVANPELKPETSLNVDVGLRYRSGPVGAEIFGFRNKIYDGIRSDFQGDSINGFPRYQNTNVVELLFRGVEVGADVDLGSGLSAHGSYTWMDSENLVDADDPVGESFSSKFVGTLRYDSPSNRFWGAAELRRNGEQKDAALDAGSAVGTVMPSFAVVHLRGGATVWRSATGMTHQLSLALTNLTNELYAETANAAFFRPEPKRNITVSWIVTF
ncbi:MAG TPA: TonB-dependent receptor [Longimicrobiales bacterium]|nr:TonB-dependent receptor [Longimicrobiales bacterium]